MMRRDFRRRALSQKVQSFTHDLWYRESMEFRQRQEFGRYSMELDKDSRKQRPRPSPRLQKLLKGGWRLRQFARLTKLTQHKYFIWFIYIVIVCTFVTPVVGFLHFAALPDNHEQDLLDSYGPVVTITNLALVVVFGLRNFALLALGLGVVRDRSIIATLMIDVLVWILNILVRCLVMTEDSWTSDNIYILSIAGLLSGLQMNTFLLVSATLSPLVKSNRGVLYRREDTVSCNVVEELIDSSNISPKYKIVLKEELEAADYDHRGELDHPQFFGFDNQAMMWFERWSSKQDEVQRHKLRDLLDKLQFSALVRQTQSEFLRQEPTETSSVEHSEGDSIIDALSRTIHHLTKGQGIRAGALVFFIVLMAMTQYLFFLVTGNILNSALEVADGIDAEAEFHNNLVYLVVVVLGNISTYYVTSAIASRLISDATTRLQREITLRVLYCGADFEKDFRPGALTNAFSANLTKTEAVWTDLQYNFIFPVASLISAVAFFCLLDVGYAMFTLAAVPLVFILHQILGSKATKASEHFSASSGRLLGRFQNIVGMQKPVKLYGSQDFLRDRMNVQLMQTNHEHYTSLLRGSVFGAAFNTVGSILLTATTIVLGIALSTGKISAGDFFSLTYFVNGVVKPLEQLGLFVGRVAFYSGAIQNLETILQYEPKMVEVRNDATESDSDSEEKLLTLETELSLEKVAFRYGPNLPFVLEDICATIPVASYMCIFGKSGSGKSSMLGLLEGFHQCTSGKIAMDGVDISTVSERRIRQKLGAVFQDTYVLDGTIFDNIAFGYDIGHKPEVIGSGYTKEQIIQAAKDAHIHEFIETLPTQYNTVIGLEADISLSGGQLQRICGLARALLRKPALLILDEATSALDTVSEQAVIETVLKLRENGMTTVSVSHHTNTAQNADIIIVLSDGRIVQSGKYLDLIEADGMFAELVAAGEQGTAKDSD